LVVVSSTGEVARRTARGERDCVALFLLLGLAHVLDHRYHQTENLEYLHLRFVRLITPPSVTLHTTQTYPEHEVRVRVFMVL